MTTNERAAAYCTELVENAQAEIVRFRASLDNNPAYAFKWADNAVKAAANLEVGTVLGRYIESGADIVEVVAMAMDSALSGASHPPSSTSASANTMEAAITAAFASFARKFASVTR